MKKFGFEIKKKLENTLGRVGVITTPHGQIQTPAFVTVGTKATVKSLNPNQIADAGAQVVLGNTYHLFLQPGDGVVAKAGGIGKFMNWPGPTMTDSGGFQVFSLGAAYGKDIAKVIRITDPGLMIPERFDDTAAPKLAHIGQDGVSFKSHLDGSIHYITPERSIQIQHNLGADIIFAFDECTSPAEDIKYQREALERTHAWAQRCLDEHAKLEMSKLDAEEKNPTANGLAERVLPKAKSSREEIRGPEQEEIFSVASQSSQKHIPSLPQTLFGIVQGGREESLRKESAQVIANMKTADGREFEGFGIGGSFAKEDMSTAVKWVNEILPEHKPRHLLGIGEPEDLFMGIENGVDLFDCVIPTRLGRNGTIYTKKGKIIIMNQKFREDFGPIEDDCTCYTCKNVDGYFSRAYVAHLFHGKEMLAGTLASIHNLHFLVTLVDNIRASIEAGTFFEYKEKFLKEYLKEE